jgi:hypothetical protein
MTKQEKLILEIRKLCREVDSEHDFLELVCAKAFFIYTSTKNLQKLKNYVVHEVEQSKKYKEKAND